MSIPINEIVNPVTTREKIFDYVTTTPNNTNIAILNTKLNQLVAEEGGSGGESGTVMFTWLYDDSEPNFTPTDVANAIREGKAVIIHIMDDPDSPDRYGYDTYLNATYHAGRVSAYFVRFDIGSRSTTVEAFLSGTIRDDEWDYVK